MIDRLVLSSVMLASLIALSAPGLARANTITVDASVEFTIRCSLREAIENHNAQGKVGVNSCDAGSAFDTIQFIQRIHDVFLDSPLPSITGSLRITSVYSPVTLHGAYFTVSNGATLKLDQISEMFGILDFRTNQSLFVNNGGTLRIANGSFTNAGAGSDAPNHGGIIDNEGGSVTLRGSALNNSQALQSGGAIFNNSGNVTIEASTISGNQAPAAASTMRPAALFDWLTTDGSEKISSRQTARLTAVASATTVVWYPSPRAIFRSPITTHRIAAVASTLTAAS